MTAPAAPNGVARFGCATPGGALWRVFRIAVVDAQTEKTRHPPIGVARVARFPIAHIARAREDTNRRTRHNTPPRTGP